MYIYMYIHAYMCIYIYIYIYIYIPFLPCPCAPFLSFLPLCLSPLLLSYSGILYSTTARK